MFALVAYLIAQLGPMASYPFLVTTIVSGAFYAHSKDPALFGGFGQYMDVGMQTCSPLFLVAWMGCLPLAILEVTYDTAEKRAGLYTKVATFYKPVVAGLFSLGILSDADFQGLVQMGHTLTLEAFSFVPMFEASAQSLPTMTFAGVSVFGIAVGGTWAVISGVVVLFLTSLRETFYEAVGGALGDDDSTGILGILLATEIGFMTLIVLTALFLPVFVLLMVILVSGIMGLFVYWSKMKEKRSQYDCDNCGTLNYPATRQCRSCNTPNPNPVTVSLLGSFKQSPAEEGEFHPLRLVSVRRCPSCARRFELRTPFQNCRRCGEVSFSESTFRERYIEYIRSRQPVMLVTLALLGLIPVIGAIVGIVLYRLNAVTPYNRYLPVSARIKNRVIMVLVGFPLLILQIFPPLGSAALPLMAWISSTLARRSFEKITYSPDKVVRLDLDQEESTSTNPAGVLTA